MSKSTSTARPAASYRGALRNAARAFRKAVRKSGKKMTWREAWNSVKAVEKGGMRMRTGSYPQVAK